MESCSNQELAKAHLNRAKELLEESGCRELSWILADLMTLVDSREGDCRDDRATVAGFSNQLNRKLRPVLPNIICDEESLD